MAIVLFTVLEKNSREVPSYTLFSLGFLGWVSITLVISYLK